MMMTSVVAVVTAVMAVAVAAVMTAVMTAVSAVTAVVIAVVVIVILVTRAGRRISERVGSAGRGLFRRDVSLVVMVLIGARMVVDVVIDTIAVSQCDLILGCRLFSLSVRVGEGADGSVVTVMVLDILVSMRGFGGDVGYEQGRGKFSVHFRFKNLILNLFCRHPF